MRLQWWSEKLGPVQVNFCRPSHGVVECLSCLYSGISPVVCICSTSSQTSLYIIICYRIYLKYRFLNQTPTSSDLIMKTGIRNLFFFLINLFIYFWLHLVFVAVRGLSLVASSRGYSSLRWLLLLWSMGSRHVGFSSCGMWAQELWLADFRVQAQ